MKPGRPTDTQTQYTDTQQSKTRYTDSTSTNPFTRQEMIRMRGSGGLTVPLNSNLTGRSIHPTHAHANMLNTDSIGMQSPCMVGRITSPAIILFSPRLIATNVSVQRSHLVQDEHHGLLECVRDVVIEGGREVEERVSNVHEHQQDLTSLTHTPQLTPHLRPNRHAKQ